MEKRACTLHPGGSIPAPDSMVMAERSLVVLRAKLRGLPLVPCSLHPVFLARERGIGH